MKRRIEPQPHVGDRIECVNGTFYLIDDQPEPDFTPDHDWKTIHITGPTKKQIAEFECEFGSELDKHSEPEPEPDKCPSCGVPYVDHSGLIGTCRKVQELTADLDHMSQYKALLSSAHGALADCGLPVPGLDQDIAPVIRRLTADRDRYKRLAGEMDKKIRKLKERLAHASGALADIDCIVTNIVTKNDTQRLNEIATAVLGRILCSADCVRTKPSWYRHEWEQREWEKYLTGEKKACGSAQEACIDQARRLTDLE